MRTKVLMATLFVAAVILGVVFFINYSGEKIQKDSNERVESAFTVNQTAASSPQEPPVIMVFGDSIAYGSWDSNGGWAKRLRSSLEADTGMDTSQYYLVYDLGVAGDTAGRLVDRFEDERSKRVVNDKKTVFIFNIGINDTVYSKSTRSCRTSAGNFKNSIRKLISYAKSTPNSKIIFLGLTPVDESKTNPFPFDKDKSYQNKYIRQYNQYIKETCGQLHVQFIDIYSEWSGLKYKSLLSDGLHPNSQGHEKIFNSVKSFLRSTGSIPPP